MVRDSETLSGQSSPDATPCIDVHDVEQQRFTGFPPLGPGPVAVLCVSI